jgi:LytS/YehU family sensor histidine kinase
VRFVLGRRMSEAPYFSEDAALLASLADVFASLHETVTMQQQQIEQERRTRELQLHASRSEVKALRAQINPHFLFNALNAIAGLTHRDPAAADRTIEQLADVFRYTLRGSLNEWVIVDEELDVVSAYLDIERTRFGPRFSFSVRLEPAASGARVPAMMIQTLVENAVKHGVAGVLHNATVDVSARVAGDHVILSVCDNGPGFLETGRGAPNEPASGFGLMNIRRRLEGHFGADASISINRERDPDRTVVAITLPLLFEEPDTRPLQFRERVP